MLSETTKKGPQPAHQTAAKIRIDPRFFYPAVLNLTAVNFSNRVLAEGKTNRGSER